MTETRPSWTPNKEKVESEEVVGRRAFGKCIAQKGGRPREGFFKLDVFYETRTDQHLSLDRLGLRQADREVRAYLTPICDEQAKLLSKEFTCWAAIRIDQIQKDVVNPTLDESQPENYFHSELDLSSYRKKNAAEALAFKLSCVATKVDPIRRNLSHTSESTGPPNEATDGAAPPDIPHKG